jgi:hypothetical protein
VHLREKADRDKPMNIEADALKSTTISSKLHHLQRQGGHDQKAAWF